MSKPSNPLSKYHTYAYHHILLMANDIGIIRAFEKNQINLTQLKSPTFYNEDTILRPKRLPNSRGEYIVLINGATDTEFVISDVNWKTIVAPTGNENYTLTNAFTEGTLKILEPKGFRFLNAIKRSLDALEVHPSTAIFTLKTIFIGYRDDGEVEIINDIKPFSFAILDIVGEFDEAGSTYDIEFVGTTNGISKMPQVINGGAAVSSINAQQSLEHTITAFSNKVKNRYDQHVTDVAKGLQTNPDIINNPSNPNFVDIRNRYRLVSYNFELDPVYKTTNTQDVGGAKYVIDQIPDVNKNQGGDNDSQNIITFGPNTTIENALYKIMGLSSQVLKDAKGDNPEKKKYMFKVYSTISETKDPSNIFDLEILYKIQRYEIPTIPPENAATGKLNNIQPQDVLEFDYLYTGKNVDILSMDLKMQMGLQFFYTLSSGNNISTAKGTSNFQFQDTEVVVNGTSEEQHGKRRSLTPLFFPTNSREKSTQHLTNPSEKLSFEALLKRHAALESLETKITIHGNPYLLNDLILTPSDFDKQERTGKTAFRNWQKRPALIKVNIKMPNTNDYNFSPTAFWYDGYYMPIEVSNEFSQGEFKQTIDMISLPIQQIFPPSSELDETDNKQPENQPTEPQATSSQQLFREDIIFNSGVVTDVLAEARFLQNVRSSEAGNRSYTSVPSNKTDGAKR